MKTLFVITGALALALAAPSFAATQTQVSIGVQLGNAPPPPVVVYQRPPHWEYVPDASVYVIDDDRVGYDYFRYGGSFYIYNAGWWYRSSNYRGPFIAVETRYVPRPIFMLNDRQYHWHHHPVYVASRDRDDVPPGWSHGKAKWKNHDDDDDEGHGHGHGHH